MELLGVKNTWWVRQSEFFHNNVTEVILTHSCTTMEPPIALVHEIAAVTVVKRCRNNDLGSH